MDHPAAALPPWLDEHQRRVGRHDPVTRIQPADLQPGTRVLTSDDGDAVALLDVAEADQTTTMALWVAPRVLRVRLRARTDAAAAAAGPLLRRAVDEAPDGVQVHLTAPSRDLPLVRPLLDTGFAAATVLAVRRPAPASPAAPCPGLVVRPADPGSRADAAALVEHRVRLQRFETTSSVVPAHPDPEPLLRDAVAEQLRERPGWSWLAERDGEVVGSCEVQPPGHADWVTGAVAEDGPVAYLEDLHVAGGRRGGGVGTALVAAAHAALAEVGTAATLLHHGATNPWSTPFWARAGYRPLATTWVRQPSWPSGREFPG
ncbi:GNAT family N-acetyltransferase [Nocardioides marmoraquaticus]